MSHATGQILFLSDKKVMHYEYNGTSDVPISHLYETKKEMLDNWRQSEWLECTCQKHEPVEIACSYAYGFTWYGRACRYCKAITAGFDPMNIEFIEDDKLPDWWVFDDDEEEDEI